MEKPALLRLRPDLALQEAIKEILACFNTYLDSIPSKKITRMITKQTKIIARSYAEQLYAVLMIAVTIDHSTVAGENFARQVKSIFSEQQNSGILIAELISLINEVRESKYKFTPGGREVAEVLARLDIWPAEMGKPRL